MKRTHMVVVVALVVGVSAGFAMAESSASEIAAAVRDKSIGVDLREMAIKDLARLGRDNASDRAKGKQVLWDVVKETDTKIAGAAVLALEELAKVDGSAAKALVSNDKADMKTRLAGLRVATGSLGNNARQQWQKMKQVRQALIAVGAVPAK